MAAPQARMSRKDGQHRIADELQHFAVMRVNRADDIAVICIEARHELRRRQGFAQAREAAYI
jgi:hypothetical protein